MSRMLIQIVPALPPTTNGVGDYALAVAGVMRSEFGLDTLFVVGNAGWQGLAEVDGFRVCRLQARSSYSLEAVLDDVRRTSGSSSVLLQLSGYGYAVRGCPFWLLQGLKQWRMKQSTSQLVTMFHELYAFGPPWSSAFWLSPAQRIIVAGIARLSDIAVTNIQSCRKCLERFDPSKRGNIAALAVPSNVGEPLDPGNLNSRSKNMIIFGQPGLRKLTYETQMSALHQVCQQLGITEVHDVGAIFCGIPDRVGNLQVRKHGLMSVSDLSSLLSRSIAGFITYPPECLAKSGVFASYCAHALIPVVPRMSDCGRRGADGIESGIHYHSVDVKHGAERPSADAQSIAYAAWNWYKGHSVRNHARVFAGALWNG